MLLSILTRKEKLKFLDLALHLVAVDGEPTDYEQRLLNIMLAEVGDNIIKEYTFKLSSNLEETINFFLESSVPVRNIIFLNLLKLTMDDEFYNTLEHFLLEEIREKFLISDVMKRKLMRLVYQERDLLEQVKRLIKE